MAKIDYMYVQWSAQYDPPVGPQVNTTTLNKMLADGWQVEREVAPSADDAQKCRLLILLFREVPS